MTPELHDSTTIRHPLFTGRETPERAQSVLQCPVLLHRSNGNGNDKQRHRHKHRRRHATMVVLLGLIALLDHRGVLAFQTPSPHHHENHHENHHNGNRRPRTVEDKSTGTGFPRTSTPSDRGDRRSSMFSPQKRQEPRGNGPSGAAGGKSRQRVVPSIWDTSAPVLVEASALRTFGFERPDVERVQVLLKKHDAVDPSSGRRRSSGEPLIARVDLWHGPDSTPQNLAIYLEEEADEDGDDYDEDWGASGSAAQGHSPRERSSSNGNGNAHTSSVDTPFSTIIETPQGHNTIAIRNIAETSDLLACVEGEERDYDYGHQESWFTPSAPPASDSGHSPLQSVIQRLKATTTPQRIDSTIANPKHTQGEGYQDYDDYDEDDEANQPVVGSCAVELPSNIASVQVLLQTQFMQPLQARIELELREGDSENTPTGGYRVVKRTIVEVFSEDGMHRPFFAVLEAPRKAGWFGSESGAAPPSRYTTSMRVVNLSTTEFPLFATVEPHAVDDHEPRRRPAPSGDQRGEEAGDGPGASQPEWTHFGGGSSFDAVSNSTILDAEIL
ncbi:unnamed protein product [Pseudo-nitzschia multistriata]|uniref:Uncharacterized protein n=1 Tax=Pseudo-nitzschia multistriata TaxID=183589 RepID=A0A448ZFK4_9STRA|nr:unnamed protein product [Pseudo-nitzschia multistriata]